MIPPDLHPIWFAVVKGSVLALGAVIRVQPCSEEPVVLVDSTGSHPVAMTYAELGGLVSRQDLLTITEAEASLLHPTTLKPGL
jgi:hypothetical protein